MKPDVREAPINIRAKTSQRDLIDMAANLVSKSRTDFMLEVACREAQDILLISACSCWTISSLLVSWKSLTHL
jgi:uncharacterized protein (DUF1778 family)